MAKGFRGGFGAKSGGGNNMQKLMQQVQAMQKEMEKEQAAIAEKTFEATSGGGVVKVVMNGEKKLQSLEIKPEAVDPDDVEMLQDLITAALNECIDTIDSETQEIMGKYTMGM